MLLFDLISQLKKEGKYKPLLHVGAISLKINNDFEIYVLYLKELETEPRKTQAAFNISVTQKLSERSVWRAIEKMTEEIPGLNELMLQ
jgi:hypothetical protein